MTTKCIATKQTWKLRGLAVVIICAVSLSGIAFSQDIRFDLESISVKGEYQLGLSRKAEVNSVNGYGGQAEIRFRIHDNIGVFLSMGFGRLDVSEVDPIKKWNWAYWTRNYRNHVIGLLGDSAYFNGQLQTLKAISNERLTSGKWTGKDSTYTVQLTPVEYINTTPVTLSFAFLHPLTETIQIDAQLSTTLLFFEKNLYLDEKWEKRRTADAGPDSGKAFYFGYGFRNFAPGKNGKALGFGGGIGLQLKVFSFVSLRVSSQFETYDFVVKNKNLDLLPFKHRFSSAVAIGIHY